MTDVGKTTTTTASSTNQKKNAGSKNKKENHEKTVPVFRIKPENKSNKATIKYVGPLRASEKLGDEVVELDRPIHPNFQTVGRYAIHAIPIKSIDSFVMIGRIYRCNIVGSHIIVSSRYPVMYLDISYERPMVSGSLFQLFCSIDINKDEKKNIKENKQYVNLQFTGEWHRHIDCDDELTENYERMLVDMLETDAAELFYKSTDDTIVKMRREYTDDQVVSWIQSYVEEERKFYDSIFKTQKITFKTITDLRDQMLSIATSEKFHKFLVIAMRCREIHRRKEYGIDDESVYVVPKNVINMTDISNKLIENDEIILD